MKKKYSLLLFITAILGLSLLIPINAGLASPGVKVTLPTFPVTLNGVVIDNDNSQYPLFVYNNITYFPMTYYDCRFLGLESRWSKNTGLEIVRSGIKWDYQKYETSFKNRSSYTAVPAQGLITVNGTQIDNSREPYPLLVFRNITYFPITWRFAVDEFGWEHAFDNHNGLRIDTNDGNKTVAGQITLPIVTRANGTKGAFTSANGYYYYEGRAGKIYQAPVADPTNAGEVYQLPIDGYSETYAVASLHNQDGRAILKYHTGGAVMGSDHRIWLREDGSNQDVSYGFAYAYARSFGNITVLISHSPAPAGNNLYLMDEAGEFKNIGEADYLYGWTWTSTWNSSGGGPSEDLYLINDDIYVLAKYQLWEPEYTTGIHRVNMKTNQTTRVCSQPASTFTVEGDYIYFKDYFLETNAEGYQSWSSDGYLYRVPVSGGTAEKLTDTRVGDYAVLKGQVYYAALEDGQLYMSGTAEPVNPGGSVSSMEIQAGYLVVIFDKASPAPHKMMIINKNGETLFETIEPVLMASIDNGKVSYVKE